MTADARREVIERAATEVFAQRGYRGAAIDEIARRAGVTPPVLYDHFASKQALYERLLDRHYAELRAIWFEHATRADAPGQWIPRAVDAWFAYIEANRFAGRMLFRDTTGDPKIEAIHRDIQLRSRAQLLPLVADEVDNTTVDGLTDSEKIELLWEVMRAVLQSLALWWYEHPTVSREQIVSTSMNAMWLGFERLLAGEQWTPGETTPLG